MRYAIALLLTSLCIIAFAQGRVADYAGHQAVTFSLDFEDGTYAWRAAGNPYQFGSDFETVEGGVAGRAWRATSKMGYLGYDGLSNIPLQAGTVSMFIKSGDSNIFTDSRAHGICTLCRTIEGMVASRDLWPKHGLALSLRKTETNTIDLVAYIGGDEWTWGAEQVVLASTDASSLDPAAWHHLAFSWDFATRDVWLIVDDETITARIPEAIERPHEYLAAIFGNTHDYRAEAQQPLDGLMDEIAVLNVPWLEAREVMASQTRYTGARPQDPTWTAEATLFPDDENLARCERVARQHLKMMVDTQRHGGWCLSIKWPSRLQWTAKFRMPEPRNMIWLSKDSHTAFGAAVLLFAHEALGDREYLAAARATGDMYIATQDPELGYWLHGYYFENGEYVPDATDPLIQDHCQTGPIMLLCYLHRVTGEQRYLDAAKRGADFLLTAQNPNGSWPHHYDVANRVGKTARGIEGGGEVNDYGTSAPVESLLNMYAYTGEQRYRDAALRGAAWLVEAFIDTGTLAGWAGQYDADNKPAEARHFEPLAVTHYAARWAAMGLYPAYSATLDEKYLAPMKRVLEWFDANKLDGEDLWWWDYDIETGRPIQMYNRDIYFLDDPEQVRAYMDVTGAVTPPKPGNWSNVAGLRWQLKDVIAHPHGNPPAPPTREQLAEYVATTAPTYVTTYVQSDSQPFNERAGLYTFDYQAGQGTNLVRHQCVRFCDLLMRARAVRGDIPIDTPLFRRIDAFVGWNKVLTEYEQ